MLENLNLKQKLEKPSYKSRMTDLSERLYRAQQRAWEEGIPVIIIFEGWDAAGKGTTIHKLTDSIDPRGYRIYPIRAARTYEKKRPWLWRFWLKTPARGEWAIFDRSWYGRVLVERMEKLVSKDEWERAYRDIVDFERTLYDSGTLIIKFFLHISKKEQKKRFDKLRKDELNAWRVTKEDLRNHKRYKKWLRVYQEMIERTDTEWGPWTVVEATDKRHTRVKVYETVLAAIESRLGIEPPEQSAAEKQPAAGEQPVAVDTLLEEPPAVSDETPPIEDPETRIIQTGVPPQAAGLADNTPISGDPGNGKESAPSSEEVQDA